MHTYFSPQPLPPAFFQETEARAARCDTRRLMASQHIDQRRTLGARQRREERWQRVTLFDFAVCPIDQYVPRRGLPLA